MNWYNIFKKSALDPMWWQNFYEHFTKAMPFVMTIPEATTRFNTSGVDGNKIWYSFVVNLLDSQYNCAVNLEFSASLSYGGGKTVWKNQNGEETWRNSTLQQVQPQGNVELVKFRWYVIKNMRLGTDASEVTGQGFILPQNATPVAILTKIKNAIISDQDDGDDDLPEPQVNAPAPTRGVPVPI